MSISPQLIRSLPLEIKPAIIADYIFTLESIAQVRGAEEAIKAGIEECLCQIYSPNLLIRFPQIQELTSQQLLLSLPITVCITLSDKCYFNVFAHIFNKFYREDGESIIIHRPFSKDIEKLVKSISTMVPLIYTKQFKSLLILPFLSNYLPTANETEIVNVIEQVYNDIISSPIHDKYEPMSEYYPLICKFLIEMLRSIDAMLILLNRKTAHKLWIQIFSHVISTNDRRIVILNLIEEACKGSSSQSSDKIRAFLIDLLRNELLNDKANYQYVHKILQCPDFLPLTIEQLMLNSGTSILSIVNWLLYLKLINGYLDSKRSTMYITDLYKRLKDLRSQAIDSLPSPNPISLNQIDLLRDRCNRILEINLNLYS
ncbi:hypothetical protein GJ496_004863 [Pomphorhynchus laevis]|nr:hypothetical protein GJ496_004863 [Pomphorhynchus laevis]